VTDPIGFRQLDRLDFSKGNGLLPAVIQHAGIGTVLMIGYMNREALEATLTRGKVVFFSRSKSRLWEKGEISGHSLEVAEIHADCDRDALLVTAWPKGPVCHLGSANCFGHDPHTSSEQLAFLGELEHVIGERMATRPEGSYTARLVASGMRRIAQKVSEEGLEVALAAAAGSDGEVVAEASDLFYHVLVLLKARGLSLERVLAELRARHALRSEFRETD
jgi:phosphoribosyl-ATP pyrophosphohydrolase/phosphoribosyl-AMP cyclohydrolase